MIGSGRNGIQDKPAILPEIKESKSCLAECSSVIAYQDPDNSPFMIYLATGPLFIFFSFSVHCRKFCFTSRIGGDLFFYPRKES